MIMETLSPTPTSVTPFYASFWHRMTHGCLFGHDYPLWRRLNASDDHLHLECPRCGDQHRALETE
jgi:hypothetical protein